MKFTKIVSMLLIATLISTLSCTKDTDTDTYTVRDGIVVIKSKAIIANGTVI